METGRIISAGFAMPLNGIASARSGVSLSGVLTWGGMVAPISEKISCANASERKQAGLSGAMDASIRRRLQSDAMPRQEQASRLVWSDSDRQAHLGEASKLVWSDCDRIGRSDRVLTGHQNYSICDSPGTGFLCLDRSCINFTAADSGNGFRRLFVFQRQN